jgi:hypothetical protein
MGNKKLPSSWLDDPEWEILRRRTQKQPISKELKQQVRPLRPESRVQTSKQADEETVINLKITVPKIKLPDPRGLYRQYRRQLKRGALIVGCLTLLIGAFKLVHVFDQKTSEDKKPLSAEDRAKQEFNPLLPLENFTDASGQASKPNSFAYDDEKKTLGYSTTYNGAWLTVSQQALPETIKKDANGLATVAQSIGADTPLKTQKGTAYILTDKKQNTQTAIFTSKELLVFVRSNKNLDEDEWKVYINQLQTAE